MIAQKRPKTVRRENRMMPPFVDRFVRPAEEADFFRRAGEIAEVIFAPREPRSHRQCGAIKQRRERKKGLAQFSVSRLLKNFQRDKNPRNRQQRQVADFGQERRGKRKAGENPKPDAGSFCARKFHDQNKRYAKTERREHVILDG